MQFEVANIYVEDVEQLSYSVDPWQFRMNQLSTGSFRGLMKLVQIGDILVSREYWSRKIVANGASPEGYLILAGPLTGEGFSWCATRTDRHHLAFAPDIREVDFTTSDDEAHWTILIPRTVIDAHLGEFTVEHLLPGIRFLSGSSLITSELFAIVLEALAVPQGHNSSQRNADNAQMFYNKLLSTVTRFLMTSTQSQIDKHKVTKRFLAYQRARSYAERLRGPISVEQLAKEANSCRRTLELGFREALGISPQMFLRYTRLNGLRRDLLGASAQTLTVTRASEKWGFTELGRTAGYYRELFGVLPSETLQHKNQLESLRFSDVLCSS